MQRQNSRSHIRGGLLAAAIIGLLAAAGPAPAGNPQRGCADASCRHCGPACGRCPQPACGQGHCGHGCRHGHCGHRPCGGCGHCGHCLHGHYGKHEAIDKRYFLRSQGKSWHSAWYDPAEGRPIALVVPPTAEFQAQYSWGVPSSRVMPIYHQFRRPYPGPGAMPGGTGFLPTPNNPSDTVQFGVNAVRGPWGAY
jgi:hypothetical protein